MRTKVVVLGGSGMLGSMVADLLARDEELEVAATARDADAAGRMAEWIPTVRWEVFDARGVDVGPLLADHGWVVNAIGIIKPFIHDDDPAEVERAVEVNALFPHLLARRAAETGARVLQIATDCVFSGAKGEYVEGDPHDALDVYGKTKSLGEVPAPHVHHLRCSIVGPEAGGRRSLLEWFRGQPHGAELRGYRNHRWNGVTTLQFARICHGVVTRGSEPPRVQHVVPAASVTKLDLLELFAQAYDRSDVTIAPADAPIVVDRTLATSNGDANRALWAAAGYAEPPSVAEMLDELAAFEYRGAPLASSPS